MKNMRGKDNGFIVNGKAGGEILCERGVWLCEMGRWKSEINVLGLHPEVSGLANGNLKLEGNADLI